MGTQLSLLHSKQMFKLMDLKIFTMYAQNNCLIGPMDSITGSPRYACKTQGTSEQVYTVIAGVCCCLLRFLLL